MSASCSIPAPPKPADPLALPDWVHEAFHGPTPQASSMRCPDLTGQNDFLFDHVLRRNFSKLLISPCKTTRLAIEKPVLYIQPRYSLQILFKNPSAKCTICTERRETSYDLYDPVQEQPGAFAYENPGGKRTTCTTILSFARLKPLEANRAPWLGPHPRSRRPRQSRAQG